jgi:hypothetical protein
MRSSTARSTRRPTGIAPSLLIAGGLAAVVASAITLSMAAYPASAIGTVIDLGDAGTYSVLGATTVTNDGALTMLDGDLGVTPGTAITGFTEEMVGGDIHSNDAHAQAAKVDMTTAYGNAFAQPSDATISTDLAGQTLAPGVYSSATTMGLSGTLQLDAFGDPDAVFIFKVGSGLNVGVGSTVELLNGAESCNVFWQVGSSAVILAGTTFAGTILALASVSTEAGTTIDGRAFAQTGAVTLITTVFERGECTRESGGGSSSGSSSATPSSSASGTGSSSPSSTTTSTATSSSSASPSASSSSGATGTPGTSSSPGDGIGGGGTGGGAGGGGDQPGTSNGAGAGERLTGTGSAPVNPALITIGVLALILGALLITRGWRRAIAESAANRH